MKVALYTALSLFIGASVAIAEVSEAQKHDFISRLEKAVSDNSLTEFEALRYTQGVPELLLSQFRSEAELTLAGLSSRNGDLTFSWDGIPETEIPKTTYYVAGYEIQSNLTPIVKLTVKIPKMKNNQMVTNTIPFALGLRDGQLFRCGSIPQDPQGFNDAVAIVSKAQPKFGPVELSLQFQSNAPGNPPPLKVDFAPNGLFGYGFAPPKGGRQLLWRFLGTTAEGDSYRISRTATRENSSINQTKVFIYSGKPLLLWDDEPCIITLQPKS